MNDRRIGPFEDAPRGAWRLIRGSVLLVVVWLWLAVSLTATSLFVLLTFRIGLHRYLHRITRVVAGGVLRVAGVRLRLVNGAPLDQRRGRIVSINHASQLDLFIMAALLPPGGTAIAKREIYRIPFLGWAFYAFDVPTIDRSNVETAKRSFERAAERIHRRRSSVFVAPEGTRSRDGLLGPFKMGLFHLAAESGAPVLPVVIRGAWECQPKGTIIPSPGIVEVETFPELQTTDWTEKDLRRRRDELRALYLEALHQEP